MVYIHEAVSAGKKVLVKGSNALVLDLDFLDLDFRAYPYVPSSSTVSRVYAFVLEFLPRRSDSPSAS